MLLDVSLHDLVSKEQVSQVSGDVQSLNTNTMLQRIGKYLRLKSWLWIGANSG
jgi:hypothetical protein